MIVRVDPITIAFLAFAGYWVFSDLTESPQCWYEYQKSDTEIVGKWEDCKPGDSDEKS